MRVAIAGAGAVGRSVAQELVANGHKLLLIERDVRKYEPHTVPEADWLLADACELSSLEECGIEMCDVVIAATGDDKTNLAMALLAKSEFGVPRVVARVNNVRNEWLFTEDWGVDIAVSTPHAMAAGVEGAMDVGHLVRLMGLRQGHANLTKFTLPPNSPLIGRTLGEMTLPSNTQLVTVQRGTRIIVPTLDEQFEDGDELLFVADESVDGDIHNLIHGDRAP
ncbi:MAG: TrkA family potassium uptake protein [Mycobacterium sp.]|nr:TrkA family potassium uptake protein [Mycobacterium sp.]